MSKESSAYKLLFDDLDKNNLGVPSGVDIVFGNLFSFLTDDMQSVCTVFLNPDFSADRGGNSKERLAFFIDDFGDFLSIWDDIDD